MNYRYKFIFKALPNSSLSICEERYMFYSKLEVQETENSSLALFDLHGVSLIHCGSLCLAEHCCKKFMYHEGSMRCFGIQIKDFDSTGKTNLITTGNEGLSTYRQGNLVYIYTRTFYRKIRYIVVTPVPCPSVCRKIFFVI